jgi:predicted nucleic acid-binding protein
MLTAVDSNVLLDFLNRDPEYGLLSRDALRACAAQGRLLICDIVWAEIAGCFPSLALCAEFLQEAQVAFSPLTQESAYAAGAGWKAYRKQGGARARIIADFLIGAHALKQADRLLTRDRGFYRAHFKSLRILDPAAA